MAKCNHWHTAVPFKGLRWFAKPFPEVADKSPTFVFDVHITIGLFTAFAMVQSGSRSTVQICPACLKILDQYGAEPFEQQQFGTAGAEGLMPNGRVSMRRILIEEVVCEHESRTWTRVTVSVVRLNCWLDCHGGEPLSQALLSSLLATEDRPSSTLVLPSTTNHCQLSFTTNNNNNSSFIFTANNPQLLHNKLPRRTCTDNKNN